MPYYIAVPDGDKYIVVSESFNVRSNAERYAVRMGWGGKCFIATEEQKAMIEGDGSLQNFPDSLAPNLDVTRTKGEGLSRDKSTRRAKRK